MMARRLFAWGPFTDPQGATSRKEILLWWESRRLTFNVLVGLVGGFTWLSVLIAGSQAVKPGVDFEEPVAMIVGPRLLAIMANICYTGGWLFDEIFYRGYPRPRLLKLGLLFSLFLTALPGVWAIYCWVRAVKTGILMD